jgi:uncharacterized membrane protein YcaP (DUF421 family)
VADIPDTIVLKRDRDLEGRRNEIWVRRMTSDDVAEEMRMQQIASFDEVQWAIVENNGQISFVKK